MLHALHVLDAPVCNITNRSEDCLHQGTGIMFCLSLTWLRRLIDGYLGPSSPT